MRRDDKIQNKRQEYEGKIKQGVGRATDDKSLATVGKVKQVGEKIKDVSKK